MSHSHAHASAEPTTLEGRLRQRRASQILIVILVPLAIWTLVGLVLLWPTNLSAHIQKDVAQFSVAGLTMPKGEVQAVNEISCAGLEGSTSASAQVCAALTVKLLDGEDTGKDVQVNVTAPVYRSGIRPGQRVVVYRVPTINGQANYQFADFARTAPVIFFAVLFLLVTVAVGRRRGLMSVLGLVWAGFIMIAFVFPALIAGSNAIMVTLVGASAIMFVALYLTHGFNTRTTTALLGTLFGLGLSAVLSYAALNWAHLTGVATEEDYTLGSAAPDMKLTAVVLSGMIIAALGGLNDVTITQASAVWELADDPGKSAGQIYRQAMRIGRDHVASTVYTIVFATVGTSMSVLLLLAMYDRPLYSTIMTEQFAVEILRTLVGAIGLALSMPLTTVIGALLVSRKSDSTDEIDATRLAAPNTSDELVDVDDYHPRPAGSFSD
ncbi:YibE/F family protein [Raineyella fluvialis]|uniref:YibE/F family protein n=1 Tax=Raineyella fluvialis TaxID=2662261 RepID=A0A5Q2F9M9_9ACTN|nr:YibE/F family protein [Raineyella fluvialis]QGF23091.1 YibE/F family protein [Raineyella fluvialis]